MINEGKNKYSMSFLGIMGACLLLILLTSIASIIKINYINSELKPGIRTESRISNLITSIEKNDLKMTVCLERGMKYAEKANMTGFTDESNRFVSLAENVNGNLNKAEKIVSAGIDSSSEDFVRSTYDSVYSILKRIRQNFDKYFLDGKNAFQMIRDGKQGEVRTLSDKLIIEENNLEQELDMLNGKLNHFEATLETMIVAEQDTVKRFMWILVILAFGTASMLLFMIIKSRKYAGIRKTRI